MKTNRQKKSSHGAGRAFTLIEIMVAVIIIAVLIGLLFPAISRARRNAQIATMKLNFQTIATGLANYKQDFRDYPRNGFALTDFWSSSYPESASSNVTLIVPPRTDGTLAMALIGPGPAAATLDGASNNYADVPPPGDAKCDMDGADGPGFKSRLAQVVLPSGVTPTLSAPANPGATTITVTPSLPAYKADSAGVIGFNFTSISLGGAGSPDAHVPILSWTGSMIKLAVPLQGTITPAASPLNAPTVTPYPAGEPVGLLTPAGQTWGPYIPVDKFKIQYFPGQLINYSGSGGSSTIPAYYSPLLTDIWGNPILYFPAYNLYTNPVTGQNVSGQFVNSINNWAPTVSIPATSTMAIGPLFGSPSSIPYAYQFNTPVDSGKHTAPSIFWIGPLVGAYGGSSASSSSAFTNGQLQAMLYKLGDVNGYNAIPAGATFPVELPYFLMSAGPDLQYTDLYPGQTTPPANSQSTWGAIMRKSGNIYSFDQ